MQTQKAKGKKRKRIFHAIYVSVMADDNMLGIQAIIDSSQVAEGANEYVRKINEMENVSSQVANKIDKHFSKIENSLASLNQQLEVSRAKLTSMANDLASIKPTNAVSSEAYAKTTEVLSNAVAMQTQLETKCKDTTASVNALHEAYNSIVGNGGATSEMIAQAQRLQDEIKGWQREYNSLDRTIEKLYDKQAKLEAKRDEIGSKQGTSSKDYKKVTNDLKEVNNQLADTSAKMNNTKSIIKTIQGEFDELGITLQSPQQRLAELRKEMALLSQNGGGGSQEYARLADEAKKVQQAIKGISSDTSEQETKVKRVRTQIMELREQMMMLKQAGKENTEEYRLLSEKLAGMQWNMIQINKQQGMLATPGTEFQAFGEAVQGATGAMSVYVAVSSMLGQSDEEVAQAQKKLQEVMALSMGVQQLLSLTYETSAFRAYALAKAKMYLTTSSLTLGKAFVSLGMSANTAKIAIATLYSVATLGIAAAIWAIVEAVSAFAKRNEEASKASKEMAEETKSYYETVGNTASKQITQFEKLRREWERTNGSLKEQLKFVNKNKDAVHQWGFAMNSVADAENIFVRNKDAVVEAFMARARASAAASIMEKNYAKILELEEKNNAPTKYVKATKENFRISTGNSMSKSGGMMSYGGNNASTREATDEELKAENERRIKEATKKRDAEKAKANKKIEALKNRNKKYADIEIKAEEDANKSLKDAGIKEYNKGEDNENKRQKAEEEKRRKADEKLRAILDKQGRERRRMEEDMAIEAEQASIDMENDKFKRQQRQRALNHKKELQAIQREAEDRNVALIEAAQSEFSADYKNKDKTFDVEKFINTDEYKNAVKKNEELANSKTKAEEATYERETMELLKEEMQARLAYIQQYGDIEQQKLAITEEYNQKLLDAQDEYTKKSLEKERDTALKTLDFESFKDKINWEGIFGNLNEATKSQLEKMKAQIVEYMDSEEFANALPENKQALIEGLNNIKDAYDAKSGAIASYFANRKGIGEAETALQGADKALQEAKSTYAKVKADRAAGKATEIDVVNASGKVARAEKERNQKQKDLDNKELEAQRKLIEALQSLNANIQSLGELSDALGIDPQSSAGKTVAGVADVANNAMGAYADFMSGNYVGALTKGIKALDGAVALFDGGNMDALNAEIERLSNANEGLASAISDMKTSIEKGSVSNASTTYEKALRLLQKQEENSMHILQDEASKWSHGGHSLNYEFNDKGGNRRAVEEAGRILGVNISTLQDFLGLSGKQMKELREANTDLYNYILQAIRDAENGHNGEGLDDLIVQYIDDYAEAYENLDNTLREKLTSTSLDSVESEFTDMLLNMDAKTQDFSNNFTEMLRNAIIKAMVSDYYSERLQQWYADFAKAMEKDGISPDELSSLRTDYEQISNDALQRRNAILDILGLDETSANQDTSTKGVGAMSQETAEELNGRFTALQISNESLLIQSTLQTGLLQSIDTRLSSFGNFVTQQQMSEVRDIQENAVGHLETIARNSAFLKTIDAKMAQIVEHTKRL